MYNKELFDRLEKKFGTEKMAIFAEIMTDRHEILYLEHLSDGIEDFTEEDYERDWWLDKSIQLKATIKTDPIIESVVEKIKSRSAVGIKKYGTTLKDNNTDDFLTHLQEELMDSVNYLEKLKDLLNQKGYINLLDVPNLNDFNEDLIR